VSAQGAGAAQALGLSGGAGGQLARTEDEEDDVDRIEVAHRLDNLIIAPIEAHHELKLRGGGFGTTSELTVVVYVVDKAA
jgi:hypothetical protein